MKSLFYPHRLPLLFCGLFLIISISSRAQVGINTTNPDNDAILDVVSTAANPGGLLLPRVALTGTANVAPLSAHVQGMTVYNTATAADVTPGYYYNNGTQWVRLAADAPSDDWSRVGNAGTVPGTGVGQNYIGTTDPQAFIVGTQGTERIRVLPNGQVVINDFSAPFGSDRLTVRGASDDDVINGYATGNGRAIYASSADYDAIYATGYRFGVFGNGLIGLLGIGNTGVQGQSTSPSGTGVIAAGNNGSAYVLGSGTGVSASGDTGVYAKSTTSSNGVGLIGLGNNNSSNIVVPIEGTGVAGSGTKLGVFGYAGNGDVSNVNRGNSAGRFVLDADNDATTNNGNNGNRAVAILAGFDNVAATRPNGNSIPARDSYFGGYFSGGNQNNSPSYAYVGLKHNTDPNGNAGTDFKVIGPGNNSTIIKDGANNPRIMFSPEAPEILFQDFGVGRLVNGIARIEIDPILSQSIYVDQNHPLKVFVTLEGDCKGIFITNKSQNGFTVKELQNGKSNVSFSWQIVASRADTKDASGKIISKHVGLRLPLGPEALDTRKNMLQLKDSELEKNTEEKQKN